MDLATLALRSAAPTVPNCCGRCSASIAHVVNNDLLLPVNSSRSTLCSSKRSLRPLSMSRPLFSFSNPQGLNQDDQDVEDLRVPDHWLAPFKALQESEWLRVTLHKWLDDEYCPEATNVEISEVAARSFYESLTAKQSDMGEILLKMARDLESISYQDSFHGAFSSANAAVNLIARRIESQ